METKSNFVNAVTANGNQMYNTPIAEGDVLVFNDIKEHSVNGGTPFQALFTSDGQFISANAFLRLGNGITYTNPGDRKKCAGELHDKVTNGLRVTITKRWQTLSSTLTNADGKPATVNNYRFREG